MLKYNFPKDLLVIDFESMYSNNSETNSPVQFACILLDKNTLQEKDAFSTFIKVDLSLISEDIKVKKSYTPEKIDNAPEPKEVANMFLEKFGKDYLITSWAANLDLKMFEKLMNSVAVSFDEFDYHVFDLWPVAYIHLLKSGYVGSARSEEMFKAFDLPSRPTSHDALEDCRHAAEVLRKVI